MVRARASAVILGAILVTGGVLAAQDLVLEGDVVTMDAGRIVRGGRLSIRSGVVHAIYESESELVAAMRMPAERLATDAWIFPGFINLHTHLPFNHQPLWVADRKFGNRYEWQAYAPHIRAVMTPVEILLGPREYNLLNEQTLYAELRAIVGGTTALAATPLTGAYTAPGRLVRNIEHEPRSRVEIRVAEVDDAFIAESASALRAALDSGATRAWVVHLAEGIDERSRKEFDRLEAAGLVRPEVVIVHGTGLGEAELAALGNVDGHLVWAPTSNLLLYGEMADVASAIASGVTVSLSNDWSPSGPHNLLAELKVAEAAYERRYGRSLAPETLVAMITTNPARAIGWEGRAGKLAAGTNGDVVVVARHSDDPYKDLIHATEEDIELVLVSGRAVIGRDDWMRTLGSEMSERLEMTGRDGGRYVRRVVVAHARGDMSFAHARARLRRALQFDPNDMVDVFLDSDGRPMSSESVERHLEIERPDLRPEVLPPIVLSDDREFFDRLRAMEFPFADMLQAIYRPFARGSAPGR